MRLATLTTTENGTTETIVLPNGKYTVKETEAPLGYDLNTNVISVEITIANTSKAPDTVNTTDNAQYGKLQIHKIQE